MSRNKWSAMNPGETLDMAASLANDLDTGSVLSALPEVSVWTRSGDTYTAAAGFTVASVQINTAELTAADGSTIAIGEAVVWRLTAGDAGRYYVRIEADADDGTHPVRWEPLTVSGPPAP